MEKGRPRREEKNMNEETITGTKATRLAIVVFALLLALAALLAFRATPAEAGLCLECGAGGGSGSDPGLCPYVESPTAINWTGTDADNKKCGSDYDDYMDGGGGSDDLWGLKGKNTLIGGTGNDVLHGVDYGNQMIPGAGQDTVYGSMGNDTVTVYADGQPDTLDGKDGYDTLKITSCQLDSVDVVKNFEVASHTAC
jgi:hypothetical protein